MSIGDQAIYPSKVKYADGCKTIMYGMSYRQWLIGMIASANPSGTAGYIIDTADEIIAELDREQTNDQERLRTTT